MKLSSVSVFRSFTHFLTGVCAIVGGVFTGESLLPDDSLHAKLQIKQMKSDCPPLCWTCAVAGLIDSLIYHSARVIQKKIELGKAS